MAYTLNTQSETPIINMHEAKTHLSAIVEEVKRLGKPVIIAKAGKPQVQILPIEQTKPKRLMGSLLDENGNVPAGLAELEKDFDTKWNDEIIAMFSGDIFPQDDTRITH